MLAFAHRGGLHLTARRNTLAAFRRAVAAGARALETDVWPGPNGVPVLVHDEPPPVRLAGLPTLADLYDELYAEVGGAFDLSLDVSAPAAVEGAVRLAAAHGGAAALGRLWLCSARGALAAWRPAYPDVRLVLSADRLTAADVAWAAEHGVDAVNQPARRWRPALRSAAAEAGVLAFGYACNTGWVLRQAHGLGLDAVYSDRLTVVLAAGTPVRPAAAAAPPQTG